VKNYAKRTGDYASLSKNDIDVMALTYELEVELNGKKNIKEIPKTVRPRKYFKTRFQPKNSSKFL
jgi:RNA-binding protein NOB1